MSTSQGCWRFQCSEEPCMVTHIFLQTVVDQGKAKPTVFMEAWYSSAGASEEHFNLLASSHGGDANTYGLQSQA